MIVNFVVESSVSYSRQKKEDLKKLSGEKLSVQSVKLGESIRQVERELADLARSLQRQSGRGDTTTASQIRSRMADRQAELDRLRASEKSITDEQKQRKSSSKLTIFWFSKRFCLINDFNVKDRNGNN